MSFAESVIVWLQKEAKKVNKSPLDLWDEWEYESNYIYQTLKKQIEEEEIKQEVLEEMNEYHFYHFSEKTPSSTAGRWEMNRGFGVFLFFSSPLLIVRLVITYTSKNAKKRRGSR